jgi:hypothetical protein
VAAGAKLVSYPEDVPNRECKAEIIVAFRSILGRGRDGEAASDQAK